MFRERDSRCRERDKRLSFSGGERDRFGQPRLSVIPILSHCARSKIPFGPLGKQLYDWRNGLR